MKTRLETFARRVALWTRAHRRLLLILALLALLLTVLGYFSKPIYAPGMCKIYG
jgi:hypothetical protein